MTRRVRFALALVLTVALALGSLSAAFAAQDKVVLRIAIPADERTMNPFTYNTGYPGHNLLMMIYDGLFQIDQSGEPKPWLVKEYSVDATGKVWTLKLYDNITWSDGQKLTAKDVKFTYEYFATPEGTHGRFSPPIVAAIEKVEAPDDTTVIFTLKAAQPSFALRPLADVPIMPDHIWTGVTDPKNFQNNVGSGPYTIAEYTPDQSYRLVANPNYFRGKPKVDEIRMVIVQDVTATFTGYQAGEVDAVARLVTPELYDQLKSRSDTRLVEGPGFSTMALWFNTERSPFNMKEFRQAVDYAIDEKSLVERVLVGRGVVGTPGWVSPELPWANKEIQPRYDVAKANQLLDSINLKDVNGDGFREDAQGKALTLDLITQADDPIRVRTIELIKEFLAAVGLNVQTRPLDRNTVIFMTWPDFDVRKGRSFDMVAMIWSAPVQMDRVRMKDLLYSDLNIGALNLGNFQNAQIDQLADALSTEVDPAKSIEIGNQLQAAIAEEVPFLALFFPKEAYAVKPAVYDGWQFSNSIGTFNKLSFVESELVAGGQSPAEQKAATGGRSSATTWIIVLVAVAAVAYLMFGRKKKASA